jgi:hypothetical protein
VSAPRSLDDRRGRADRPGAGELTQAQAQAYAAGFADGGQRLAGELGA